MKNQRAYLQWAILILYKRKVLDKHEVAATLDKSTVATTRSHFLYIF